MIVADTSAWIDFVGATNRPADLALQRLLAQRADLAVTEVVVMELLAGARSPRDLPQQAGATVLHADDDFDVLARHTPLEVEPLAA